MTLVAGPWWRHRFLIILALYMTVAECAQHSRKKCSGTQPNLAEEILKCLAKTHLITGRYRDSERSARAHQVQDSKWVAKGRLRPRAQIQRPEENKVRRNFDWNFETATMRQVDNAKRPSIRVAGWHTAGV